MTITLRPEQEKLIADLVRSGAYQNADQVLEKALELLHEHETWLAENRTRIEEGYAAAERGELIEDDRVRAQLAERKRAFLVEHRE
jgi:antitoxin ParD1/3/4